MKKSLLAWRGPMLALLSLLYTTAPGATIYWVNSEGSEADLWSWPGNWNPPQVPGPGDTAVVATLTPGGNPAFVNLDTDIYVGGLIIGTNYTCSNPAGTDSLRDGGFNITLYGPLVINECAEFDWYGGNIIGGSTNASLTGTINWVAAGELGGTLTLTTNSFLNANTGFTRDMPNAVLNNYGTVTFSPDCVDCPDEPMRGGGTSGTVINNYGLWNCTTDLVINAAFGGNGLMFNNFGSFVVSGGTSGSQFQSGAAFNNYGSADVQVASLALEGGGSGTGLYTAEAGTTLEFSGGTYTAGSGASFTGAGTNLINGANFTVSGSISMSNTVLEAGALAGSAGIVNGSFLWTGGQIGIGGASALTLGANTVTTLAGQSGVEYDVLGSLTNEGTLVITGGNLRLRGDYSGELINVGGGLLNFAADSSLDQYGATTFYNYGVVRKTAAGGTSTIDPSFENWGVLDVESGTVTMVGGGAFSLGSSILGPGSSRFSLGNFNMNVFLGSTNVVQAGANLTGTNAMSGPGVWTWMAGYVGLNAADVLTLSTNTTLIVAGQNGYDYDLFGTLTNEGTIELVSGNLRLRGEYSAQLFNMPGALLNILADVSVDEYSTVPPIYNYGTVRKSAAGGTSIISPSLVNFGTVDVHSGTLSLNGGGSGTGLYLAESGTMLGFGASTYTASPGAVITGAGTTLLSGAAFILNTSLSTTNGVLSEGALSGNSGIVSGSWMWTGGQIGSGTTNTLMMASNTTLTLAGSVGSDYDILGTLTNAGTIVLDSGNIRLRGDYGGELINAGGGLLNFAADSSLDQYNATIFLNYGVVRKTAAAGTSTISPSFDNGGVLDVESGTVSLVGGGVFSSGSSILGPGSSRFSLGNFNMNVFLESTNVVQAGANLTGTNAMSGPGVWTWTAGYVGLNAGDVLTLSTNTTLILAGQNGYDYDLFGSLTNEGTIELVSGALRLRGDYSAQLFNMPGALLNIAADVSVDEYATVPPIYNYGTVRKSAAGGTSVVNPSFINAGNLDVRSGTLSLNGGGSGTGSYLAEAGTTLAFGASSTYTMNPAAVLTGAGTNEINGAALVLNTTSSTSNGILASGYLSGNGTVNGVWTWTGGSIGNPNLAGALTLGSHAVMTLTAQNGSANDVFYTLTNAGTLLLASGDVRLRGDYSAQIINQQGALIALETNNSMDVYGGAPMLYNNGTLRKAGGTGTSTISPYLVNAGTLDAQIGLISVVGGNNLLANGDLNFGINSLSNYGQMSLPGTASLAGSVSANLNGGYQPATGNSFTVLNYGGSSGLFASATLPPTDLWQTNYNPNSFVLTVAAAGPTLTNPQWLGNGQFQFSFSTSTQALYVVLFSTNLSSGAWLPLSTNAGSGGLMTVLDDGPRNGLCRFYKLELLP